jgi:hypothetical protein
MTPPSSSRKSTVMKDPCFLWTRLLVERISVGGARPPKRDGEADSQASITSGLKPNLVTFTLFVNVNKDARPSGRRSPYLQSAMSHGGTRGQHLWGSAPVTASVEYSSPPPLAPGSVQELLEISITCSVPLNRGTAGGVAP